jgi:hypothetical protein
MDTVLAVELGLADGFEFVDVPLYEYLFLNIE